MTTTRAPALGLLHFRGVDGRKFLQGLLSNDMDALGAEAFMLAGLHNPQGRVLALLRLAAPAADHVVAVLPAELAATTAVTLRRYLLRAKVAITEETSAEALARLAATMPAAAPILRARRARARHRRRRATGIRRDQRPVRRPDAEPRLRRRRVLRQGLLHWGRRSSRARTIAAA